jgi:hypothetical protein
MMGKRSPLGEAGVGGAGFLRVCGVDLGLENCNEDPNCSPNGQFSPRLGAGALLAQVGTH